MGDGITRWTLGGRIFTPEVVSGLILGRLRSAAEMALGEPVSEAVVTVPAYFTHHQRQATLAAAGEAGLRVLQLLPEPTAAALSYGMARGRDQTALVYDLGGGTFDASLMRVAGDRFEVVAVDGDSRLGGDDFDRVLALRLLERFEGSQSTSETRVCLQTLRRDG